MSKLFNANKNLQAKGNSLLSGQVEELTMDAIAAMPDFEEKLVKAMNEGRIDEIVLQHVAAALTGENHIFQVTGFADSDTKDEFDYTVKGQDRKAIRRSMWLKAGKVTAMMNIPLPLAIGKDLKVGDSLTLSVHPVKAGTSVYQADAKFFADDADAIIRRVPFGQDTFIPATGCGFNAFETTINELAAQKVAQFNNLAQLQAVEV